MVARGNSIYGAPLLPFRNGDGEPVCPLVLCLCSLKWFEQAAYSVWAEYWDISGMAGIRSCSFVQHQTLLTQMVQTIRGCMAPLSRSQLSEPISAAPEQWVLFALFSVPAYSERTVSGHHIDRPPPPLQSSVILWKSCVASWKCESLPAMRRSRALKEDLEWLYMYVSCLMITAGLRLIWNLIGISVRFVKYDDGDYLNLVLFLNHKSFCRYSATSKLLTEPLVWSAQQSGSGEHSRPIIINKCINIGLNLLSAVMLPIVLKLFIFLVVLQFEKPTAGPYQLKELWLRVTTRSQVKLFLSDVWTSLNQIAQRMKAASPCSHSNLTRGLIINSIGHREVDKKEVSNTQSDANEELSNRKMQVCIYEKFGLLWNCRDKSD